MFIHFQKIFILLLCVLPSLTCVAQPYYFRRYQVENGLSHNSVYCTLQDRNGFLWFGTRDGLNRFDGRNFKIFQHDPEDPFSLKNNLIHSLFEDGNGTMWVGTYRGLYKYNPKNENFSIVKNTGTYSVRSVVVDNNNNIWFIGRNALCVYQQKTDSILYYPNQQYFNATTICKTRDNVIWIGSNDGRLQKYNPETNSFTAYEVFDASSLARSHDMESIYPTADNKLLVGTLYDGVHLFDIAKGTAVTIGMDHHNYVISARCFLEKKSGEYWIGSESGIYIYHRDSNTIDHLEKNYNNPYALSDNAIYCLTRDKDGAVWIGSYFGGVNYYSNQQMVFEKFFPDYSSRAIRGNAVTEICQDRYDNLWIATEDAGINRLERKTNTFTHFSPHDVNTGLSYFNYHCILLVADTLWAGTWGHGIDLLNIKTGKVFRRYKAGSGENDLKTNTIQRFCKSTGGDVYVGTDNGLYAYDQQSKHFTRVIEIPSNEPVYAILEDKKGTVWVGSRGQSIYYFNKKSKQHGAINTALSSSGGEDAGLNQVTGISEDSNGLLWFATEGSGVITYRPAEHKIGKRFSTKNGLPSNTIFKILEDEQNILWISTSKGLVRLNPFNDSIKIFTRATGLLNDQFNYNSGFRSRDGSMYFGSIKGLISFKPADFTPNQNQSPIYITGLQVNNKELLINKKNSPLNESILTAKKIVLKFEQSSFSIDFASLSFLAPDMLEYKYMMTGVDKNWIHLKSNRRVYYTELPAGSYTFKVTGANNSGTWSNKETTLEIEILPPWWASKVAFVIYAILFLAITVLIIRFYKKRGMEKNRIRISEIEHEKEKQIYEAKIEFFTNVAHEIRTPLTLIKAPLERVIKKAGSNHAFGNNLEIMESNTELLIDLTNQFLDFRKIETSSFRMEFTNVNISALLMDRFASFKPIAEEKNIQFTVNMPDQDVFAFVDIDSMLKILNNLFTNALKYGEEKVCVQLSVLCEQDRFMIEFSNDGALIPNNMREMIFEPFFRIKETGGDTGTGIGLAISRSLAEMHKGKIYLDEPNNSMNNFILILPIHNNINQ